MIMEVNCLQYQQLVIEQGQMMLNIVSTPCKFGGWAPHPVKWWNMVGIWLEYGWKMFGKWLENGWKMVGK